MGSKFLGKYLPYFSQNNMIFIMLGNDHRWV